MNIIDGRMLARKRIEKLRDNFENFIVQGIRPKAAIIVTEANPAVRSYLKQKKEYFKKVGAALEIIDFEKKSTTAGVVEKISELNADQHIHGYMLEMPLSKNIDKQKLISHIHPLKDLDGFAFENCGRLMYGPEYEFLVPSTARGVINMLTDLHIKIEGKHVAIIGHSDIVGKPLSMMLICRNATVSTCHIFTPDISNFTRNADIVISATGQPGLIKNDMVKKGLIAIDIGMTLKNNKLMGDFDFENVKKKARMITPVPGGTGPMTVAALLENLLAVMKKQYTN